VPEAELADLHVGDGDLVTASGTVLVTPGQPVRFCAQVAVALPGYAGPERPPACEFAVALVGADPDRLAAPKAYQRTRWGGAAITGRYTAGTVTVTAQGPPVAEPAAYRRTHLPDRTPCPPPPGGWRPGPIPRDQLDTLMQAIEARPTAYGEAVMTYPDGIPTGPMNAPGEPDPTEVAMVTTTLDPVAAELDLRAVYPGNLCIGAAVRSRADTDAVWRRVDPQRVGDAGWRRHRVHTGGPDHFAGRVRLSLVVLDDAAYAWLREVDAGTGILDARPWLRPATPR
jgi:hypothetical protein